MPKLIVSIDGVVIKEVQLTKDRTTLGRRPYNDIVIDNLAVSGEHAVLEISTEGVQLEDLGSTNGTYVNGKAVKRQALQHEDTIEVGKYKIKFLGEAPAGKLDMAAGVETALVAPASAPAVVRVLSGASAGREVPLHKPVTTIGKPGVAVAAITRQLAGYVVAHVEGTTHALLNGVEVGSEPLALTHGDTLELAGTRMEFIQA
jgi:hypothetical protein